MESQKKTRKHKKATFTFNRIYFIFFYKRFNIMCFTLNRFTFPETVVGISFTNLTPSLNLKQLLFNKKTAPIVIGN